MYVYLSSMSKIYFKSMAKEEISMKTHTLIHFNMYGFMSLIIRKLTCIIIISLIIFNKIEQIYVYEKYG